MKKCVPVVVLCLLSVLLAAGCSSKSSSSKTSSSTGETSGGTSATTSSGHSSSLPNPCSLLTTDAIAAAESSNVTGGNATFVAQSGVQSRSSVLDTQCKWQTDNTGDTGGYNTTEVILGVGMATSIRTVQQRYDGAKTLMDQAVSAPGLGTEAATGGIAGNDAVLVLAPPYVFDIQFSNAIIEKPALVELAQQVQAALKAH